MESEFFRIYSLPRKKFFFSKFEFQFSHTAENANDDIDIDTKYNNH